VLDGADGTATGGGADTPVATALWIPDSPPYG